MPVSSYFKHSTLVYRLLGLLLVCCNAQKRQHQDSNPWQLRVEGPSAAVYSATQFYEALAHVGQEETLQEIILAESFYIEASVWLPEICLQRNLTIRGADPDVTVSISSPTTLVAVPSGTLKLEGFHFKVVGNESEKPFLGWFAATQEGHVEIRDLAWTVPPVQVHRLRLLSETPPPRAEYINIRFFALSAVERVQLGAPVKRIAHQGRGIIDAFQVATKPGRDAERVDIQIHGNVTLKKDDVNGTSPMMFRRVMTITGKNGTLEIDPDLLDKGLGDFAPVGRLHFSDITLLNDLGKKDDFDLHKDLNSAGVFEMFSWIGYPQQVEHRCMTSFARSTIWMPCAAAQSLLDGFSAGDIVAEKISIPNTDEPVHFVHRAMYKGICFSNVAVTCSEQGLPYQSVADMSSLSVKGAPTVVMLSDQSSVVVTESSSLAENEGGTSFLIWVFVVSIGIIVLIVVIAAYLRGYGTGKYGQLISIKNTVLGVSGSRKKHLAFHRIPAENCTSIPVNAAPQKPNSISRSGVLNFHDALMFDLEDGDIPPFDETDFDEELVQVDDYIGSGGYGVVYKGRWKGKPVAIKTTFVQEAPHTTSCKKQRAILEAGIGLSLSHPNIVQTFAYTVKKVKATTGRGASQASSLSSNMNWKIYMVQEYCEGGTLLQAMERRVFLQPVSLLPDLRAIMQTALDVAKGVSHLHNQNIIHGDLTAKNILLRHTSGRDPQLTGKIADFGLSVRLQKAENLLQNFKVGTPLFMAPEVRKHGILTKKADVYSFGVVLWEMYNSALPKLMQCERKGRNLQVPVTCPLPYVLLVGLCLSPKPADRPEFETITRILENLLSCSNGPSFRNGELVRKSNREMTSMMGRMTRPQVLPYLLGIQANPSDVEEEVAEDSSYKTPVLQVPSDWGRLFTAGDTFRVSVDYCPRRGLEFITFAWCENPSPSKELVDTGNEVSKTHSAETEDSSRSIDYYSTDQTLMLTARSCSGISCPVFSGSGSLSGNTLEFPIAELHSRSNPV